MCVYHCTFKAFPGIQWRQTFVFKKIDPVANDAIERELHEMRDVVLAKTADRSIVGTLNDYRKNMEFMASINRLEVDDPLAMSLKMSATPSLVMPGTWPQDVTLKLFAQEPSKPAAVASLGPRLVLVR